MAQPSRYVSRSRQFPRTRLAPMYTLIRVKPRGDKRYRWTGHIYDISMNGARIELDEPLEPGAQVDLRAMLPGHQTITIHATGQIVRLHSDSDEPGPARMAVTFDRFTRQADGNDLDAYLERVRKIAA